ncbi:MAG: hypothetical protein N3D76_02830, partial [Geminocystis sp.]|nr:hypothetical protein [Geminocystis sp.]
MDYRRGRRRRVLFLTEGYRQIGFGHITRCTSIYQAVGILGGEALMLVRGDYNTRCILKGIKYELCDWHNRWGEVKNRLKDFDTVVIDSYLADWEIYQEASDNVKVCLYIDDFKRLEYPKGIILNGGIHGEMLDYPKEEGRIYLLGPKFIPLREAFWGVGLKRINKELKRALITFGGADSRNMTLEVLRLLRKEHPELELFVVVGKGFKNKEEVYKLKDEKIRVFESLSGEEMRDLMTMVDLAVSAGGQTTYELARVGVPSVLVAVADNQLLNCKGWEKAGFAFYAGWWEDKELWKKLSEGVEKLKDYEL